MLTKGAGSFAAIINSAMSYLLRAFTSDTGASDQSYSNAQVLDTAAEGVLDGSLIVTEVAGTAALSSTVAVFSAKAALGTDLGIVDNVGSAKTIGKALFGSIRANTNNATYGPGLIWCVEGILDINSRRYSCFLKNTGYIDFAVLTTAPATLYTVSLVSFSAGTYYNIVLVLGGYDSNGVPYKNGDTKSSFTYGCSAFLEVSGTYNLIWKSSNYADATLYGGVNAIEQGASTKNLLIPDYDFSAVLQPIVLDTFTDTDGTALADHTPDVCPVGSAWSVVAGTDWDIQSNKLTCRGAADDKSAIDCGESDVFIESVLTLQKTDSSNFSAPGILLRYSDNTHLWLVSTDPEGLKLFELAGGSYTQRASSSVTINGNTAYNVKVKASGTTISAWLNDANAISYASASSNQTETKVGVRYSKLGTPPADSTWDNFAVYPLTSTTIDAEFAKAGYDY